MTGKKLTDEEIIKRLERCVNRGNRNYDTDIVLDLIKCQQSEIENLKVENQSLRSAANSLKIHYEEVQAENKKLKECPKCIYEYDGEITEYCVQGPCSNFKTVGQVKAEAYKEFADKLENICEEIIAQEWNEKTAPISWSYAYADFIDDIDNLLKEMVGE